MFPRQLLIYFDDLDKCWIMVAGDKVKVQLWLKVKPIPDLASMDLRHCRVTVEQSIISDNMASLAECLNACGYSPAGKGDSVRHLWLGRLQKGNPHWLRFHSLASSKKFKFASLVAFLNEEEERLQKVLGDLRKAAAKAGSSVDEPAV